MKEYGFNKATEFTKKQIGVIYYKAKSGELKVEKWFMSFLYDLADYYGTDSNRLVEERESEVLKILDNVFSNKIDEAQELINEKELRQKFICRLKNKPSGGGYSTAKEIYYEIIYCIFCKRRR